METGMKALFADVTKNSWKLHKSRNKVHCPQFQNNPATINHQKKRKRGEISYLMHTICERSKRKSVCFVKGSRKELGKNRQCICRETCPQVGQFVKTEYRAIYQTGKSSAFWQRTPQTSHSYREQLAPKKKGFQTSKSIRVSCLLTWREQTVS